MSENIIHEVVIIGSGAGGLSTAQHLVKNGVKDVVVLEALPQIGGRIATFSGFVPWGNLSLGAEYVHSYGPLYDMFVSHGCTLRQRFTCSMGDGPWPDEPVADGGVGFIYVGEQKQMLAYDTTNENFCGVKKLVRQLYEGEVQLDGNPNMLEFFRQHGFNDEMISMAQAAFGNTVCAPLERLGVKETSELLQIWDNNEGENYVPDETMYQFIKWYSEDLPDVRCNWKVTEVNYEDDLVTVRREDGETIKARHVVVAVPVSIMKRGMIDFVPDLPADKQEAIKSIDMFPACKVILRFTRRFWPVNYHGGICSGSFIPELWMDGPERLGYVVTSSKTDEKKEEKEKIDQNEIGSYLVVGFATAKYCDAVSELTDEEAAQRFLAQLDEMFGTEENPNPASSCNDGFHVHNWGKVPTILGGYSTTSSGASKTARFELAKSVEKKLFFAGEACNSDSMSVHSALASGVAAANEIIQSIH